MSEHDAGPAVSTQSWAADRTLRALAGYVRLESVNPAQNRARFYTLHWQPLLWGGAALMRSWGRIGSRGRTQMLLEAEQPQIDAAVQRLIRRRLRHGYQLVDWQ